MDLMDYLNSATKSLFRFEALQVYEVEGDTLDDSGMKEWWDFIESKTKSGVVMERVRLVIEPLTDYTMKELEIHKKSAEHGDDISIIKENIFTTLDIPIKDFWLIDDDTVLIMNYDEAGKYLGFSSDENIDEYIQIKQKLLRNSTSISS